MIRSDEGLLSLLDRLISHTRSQGMGEAVVFTQMRLNPEWIRPYADPAEIALRLAALTQGETLSEEQREMADQYLKEHELLQQGKDPESL